MCFQAERLLTLGKVEGLSETRTALTFWPSASCPSTSTIWSSSFVLGSTHTYRHNRTFDVLVVGNFKLKMLTIWYSLYHLAASVSSHNHKQCAQCVGHNDILCKFALHFLHCVVTASSIQGWTNCMKDTHHPQIQLMLQVIVVRIEDHFLSSFQHTPWWRD